jgi:hypothetical protein
MLARKLPHFLIHKRTATVPDFDHKPPDRVAVRIGHALCGADRIPLDKSTDDLRATGE